MTNENLEIFNLRKQNKSFNLVKQMIKSFIYLLKKNYII